MNIAVIGLGSMGKRRIRLIRKYDASINIIGIDTNNERRSTCQKEYGIETYDKLNDLFKKDNIDCAFICTPPLTHSNISSQCLRNNIHVFTELNLVTDGYEENIELANKRGLTLFLSSTFLYREEIKYIKNIAQQTESMLNYIYHSGQYLPDWHPWEDYRDFFVSNKDSNACREIFAIELPWLNNVFGEIIQVDVLKNKISSLDINYYDNYIVLMKHASGHKGVLAVDVVSRKAVRNLEIYGEKTYIKWDGSPTGLYEYDIQDKREKNIRLYKEIDHLDNYSSHIVENAYMNEIRAFFEVLSGISAPIYSFEQDMHILSIIDKIEA